MNDTSHGTRRGAALGAMVAAALLCATPSHAQDDLAGAKTLYVNASYEEALVVLDKQAAGAGATGARAAEVHHYRALCLIALGRAGDADQAIALSVAADPFTVPDTSELSPRVASVFTAARARLIPDVARAALAEGRQLMQKGDAAAANARFEAVTTLLAEPGLANRPDLADLTLAANAFAELARAQIAAAKAAAATVISSPPAADAATAPAATNGGAAATPTSNVVTGAPAAAAGAGSAAARPRTPASQPPPSTLRPPAPVVVDPSFVPASPIAQTLPRWQPENSAVRQLGFVGAVRVTIDATGKVTGAVMDRPVYPPYDRQLLVAARSWSYRPATRNGQPVASERLVEIVLRPPTN
jgi:periplasmic protein TonB